MNVIINGVTRQVSDEPPRWKPGQIRFRWTTPSGRSYLNGPTQYPLKGAATTAWDTAGALMP